ncbi:MAG: hypothetical protein DMF91_14665 [Acidobacteria bacterium]|nr:MAG: hypothetical protein DMF91_14665 [Acidobacteriota bacterium]
MSLKIENTDRPYMKRPATVLIPPGGAGHGTTKGPALTVPDVQSQSDGALFWKISGGNTRRGMPTFSFLPEAQRWQLVLHLRSLAGANETALTHSAGR